jgi:histone H3/H4
MKQKRLLALATMEEIMLTVGAERVSKDAKIELKNILEEKAKAISEVALRMAKHAGRRTIKATDIRFANKGETK